MISSKIQGQYEGFRLNLNLRNWFFKNTLQISLATKTALNINEDLSLKHLFTANFQQQQ